MALTQKKVERPRKPGRYCDGHGLYLQIVGASRIWLFRYERRNGDPGLAGKRREHALGLGPLHTLSLEEAREAARQCRKQLLDGQSRGRPRLAVARYAASPHPHST